MKKKGAISLEALVKFIPAFLIAIVGLTVLFTLWGVFWKEEISTAQYDMLRVYRNMEDLNPGESIDVFTKAPFFSLRLFAKDQKNAEEKCAGEPCICVYEVIDGESIATKCEKFTNINCEKSMSDPNTYGCVKPSLVAWTFASTPSQPAYVVVSKDIKTGELKLEHG